MPSFLRGLDADQVSLPFISSKVDDRYKATRKRYPEAFHSDTPLPRSSHSFNVINNKAFLFGGEIKPREPVDASVKSFSLESVSADLKTTSVSSGPDGEAPSPRVGHTSVRVGDCLYVWGGKTGVNPEPLEEAGQVWQFSTSTYNWTPLNPSVGPPYPEGRSYHASASDEASGVVYIHAGCPTSGRQTDIWGFKVATREWRQLPSAPKPARGGPGFTFALGKLWRYGGFDGKQELGGQLDYFDVQSKDAEWKSTTFEAGNCPGGRSITGLQGVTVAGKSYLVAFFGERDASNLGHAGAGVFWGDIWALPLTKEGEVAPDSWEECKVMGAQPERGWFAYDLATPDTIAVYGGLNAHNERESDGYLITIAPCE